MDDLSKHSDEAAQSRMISYSLELGWLPGVLCLTAGSVDAISFLALGGFFMAHMTGNIVVLATQPLSDKTTLVRVLSIPIFLFTAAAARILANVLERKKIPVLPILLLIQFLLLCAFFVMSLASAPMADMGAVGTIAASMCGVSAMALQNALVQICFQGLPSTTVMTTNVTRFALDLVEPIGAPTGINARKARESARRSWKLITAFVIGCSSGAFMEHVAGLWSLMMPIAFEFAALGMAIWLEFRR